jgi:hypothetical protein
MIWGQALHYLHFRSRLIEVNQQHLFNLAQDQSGLGSQQLKVVETKRCVVKRAGKLLMHKQKMQKRNA